MHIIIYHIRSTNMHLTLKLYVQYNMDFSRLSIDCHVVRIELNVFERNCASHMAMAKTIGTSCLVAMLILTRSFNHVAWNHTSFHARGKAECSSSFLWIYNYSQTCMRILVIDHLFIVWYGSLNISISNAILLMSNNYIICIYIMIMTV